MILFVYIGFFCLIYYPYLKSYLFIIFSKFLYTFLIFRKKVFFGLKIPRVIRVIKELSLEC